MRGPRSASPIAVSVRETETVLAGVKSGMTRGSDDLPALRLHGLWGMLLEYGE